MINRSKPDIIDALWDLLSDEEKAEIMAEYEPIYKVAREMAKVARDNLDKQIVDILMEHYKKDNERY